MGLVELSPSDIASLKSDKEGNALITENVVTEASKDTFINRTALSPTTYPEIFGTLVSYVEGTPVITEYFKKRVPYINKETGDLSFSLERAAVHYSYDLVHNFELRIQGSLSIETNPDTTETSATGEGIIYPGFNPNVGDLFYLRMPDDQIGLFLVDQVTPLSISRMTQNKIEFHLYDFVDTTIDAKMQESVAEELWFDKQHYFDDEVTLLADSSYKRLTRLLEVRTNIIDRIFAKFYNCEEKTVIRPDGIYDAYVVEFLTNKIGVSDSYQDICQLDNDYTGCKYHETIWASLLDSEVTNLKSFAYTLYDYRHYAWDTNISNMDRFPIVYLRNNVIEKIDARLTPVKFDEADAEPKIKSYHLSSRLYYAIIKAFEDLLTPEDLTLQLPLFAPDDHDRFFEDDSTEYFCIKEDSYQPMAFFDAHNIDSGSNNDIHLPEIEYLIYDYLINGNIDIDYLINKVLVKFPLTKLTEQDRFYYFPVLLHMIDTAIIKIR